MRNRFATAPSAGARWALVAALVAVAAALPMPVAAQQAPLGSTLQLGTPVVTGSPSAGEDGERASVAVPWTYTFHDAATATAASASTGVVTLTFGAVRCVQPGLVWTGPAVVQVTTVAGQASYSGTWNASVSATQAAPGAVGIACYVTASGDAVNAQVPSTAVANVTATIVVQPLVRLSVNVPTAIDEATPGGQVHFTVNVQNRGNTDAQAAIALDADAALPDGWSVELPAPVVVARGQNASLMLLVKTPGGGLWTNTEQVIQVHVEATALGPGGTPVGSVSQAQPSALQLLARSRGLEVASPGGLFVLGGLLGAVLVGVVLLRRRMGTGRIRFR